MKRSLTLAACLCIAAAALAQPRPKETPTEPSVHDPAVIQADGTWYMFTTGQCIDILTSADRVNWKRAGHALDAAPEWAVKMVPGYRGHTWAPDISYHNGLYYLYYSCSTFGKNTSAIGVAVNSTLDPASASYKWIDKGCVVNSVGGRDNYNAIDPNLIIDADGTPWLSFGSFWEGIKMVRLDSTLTRPAEPQEWYPLCRRPEGTVLDTSASDDAIKADERGHDFDPGNGAVEAPFIIYRDGWYYLFVSYDLCCRGAKSTYKVVTGRSQKVTGPYLDAAGTPLMQGGGTIVVQGNERFPGVGHCAVVEQDGTHHMFFHGYDRDHGYNSILLVRPITWSTEGWPTVTL